MARAVSIKHVGVFLAMMVAASCGRSEPGPAASRDASVTTGETNEVTAESSIDPFAAAKTGFRLRSDVVSTKSGPLAVIGLEVTPKDRTIVVAEFVNGEWVDVASLDLPFPWFSFAPGRNVEIGDVTADGDPDFLLPLNAQSAIGVVVSQLAGTWTLVPVRAADGTTTAYVGLEPHMVDGELVSMNRTCEPSCADGPTYEVTWVYKDAAFVSEAKSTSHDAE